MRAEKIFNSYIDRDSTINFNLTETAQETLIKRGWNKDGIEGLRVCLMDFIMEKLNEQIIRRESVLK